jgi:hypothetical protein
VRSPRPTFCFWRQVAGQPDSPARQAQRQALRGSLLPAPRGPVLRMTFQTASNRQSASSGGSSHLCSTMRAERGNEFCRSPSEQILNGAGPWGLRAVPQRKRRAAPSQERIQNDFESAIDGLWQACLRLSGVSRQYDCSVFLEDYTCRGDQVRHQANAGSTGSVPCRQVPPPNPLAFRPSRVGVAMHDLLQRHTDAFGKVT